MNKFLTTVTLIGTMAVASLAQANTTTSHVTIQYPAISIEKAIEIAQKTASGKAIEVELEQEHFGQFWEVKVIQPNGLETKVVIDAQSGQLFHGSL